MINEEKFMCEEILRLNEIQEETQQISGKVEQKILEVMKTSNLIDLLAENGILANEAIEIKIRIELNKLQPQAEQVAETSSVPAFNIMALCTQLVPCPDDPSKTCMIKVRC